MNFQFQYPNNPHSGSIRRKLKQLKNELMKQTAASPTMTSPDMTSHVIISTTITTTTTTTTTPTSLTSSPSVKSKRRLLKTRRANSLPTIISPTKQQSHGHQAQDQLENLLLSPISTTNSYLVLEEEENVSGSHMAQEENLIPPLPPVQSVSFHAQHKSRNSQQSSIYSTSTEDHMLNLHAFSSSVSSISTNGDNESVSELGAGEKHVHREEEDVDKLANSILKVIKVDNDIQWGI